MGQKLAAGSISGGIGAVLTTPIELAKTRLQVGSKCGGVAVVLGGGGAWGGEAREVGTAESHSTDTTVVSVEGEADSW
jgi:hypothetical protein